MRLTQFSDYALRLLIYVAQYPEHRVTIAEVAGTLAISRNHLMKVANRLSKAGLLRPSRGRAGGLALGKAAAEVSVGDVLRATEPDFFLVGSMAHGACVTRAEYHLREALQNALSAFFLSADRQTLADLAAHSTDKVSP